MEIITSLSIPELKNLLKDAIKEVKQEEDKKSTIEKTYSIHQTSKIVKCSDYKIKNLIAKGLLTVNKNNRIAQSVLNSFLDIK